MKFRTLHLDLWSEWPIDWLDAVARNAEWVVVRMPGLMSRHSRSPVDVDTPSMRWWEQNTRTILGSPSVAYAYMAASKYADPTDPSLARGNVGRGLQAYKSWASGLHWHWRIQHMLQHLRYATAPRGGLVLAAEDISVRWLLESRHQADGWILDTPLVSGAECSERYYGLLNRPVFAIRRANLQPILTRWRTLRLHFDPSELLCMKVPEQKTRIGEWSRASSLAKRTLDELL